MSPAITTKRSSLRGWRRAGLGALLAAALAGCSALFDLSAVQCETKDDCTGELAGRVCQAGLCVVESVATGGQAGAAGAETGGGPSGGGPTGGQAGSGGTAPCTTHAQCVEANWDPAYACLDGECVWLKTEECSVVLQEEFLLDHDEVILIGAYANVQQDQSARINALDLALTEFNERGLPGGPSGQRRAFVAVLCNSQFTDVTPGATAHLQPSIDHLMKKLKVPAILAGLDTTDLRAAYYATLADTTIDPPLFMNPMAADSDLELEDTAGLLWHTLGDTINLGAPFVRLIEDAEAKLALAEPMRVALVYSDVTALRDIADYIAANLTFNGLSTTANGANFLSRQIVYEATDPGASYAADAEALTVFQPHLVVAITGGEFVSGLLGPLEGLGAAARPRFYVLGHRLAYRTLLTTAISNYSSSGLEYRVAGVNYAGAADPTLRDAFVQRYNAAYSGAEDPTAYENFYDAPYYVLYAIAAAGGVPSLTGEAVASGLSRLLDPNAAFQYEVGRTDLPSVLSTLQSFPDDWIGLTGTLGPPNWNLGTGARISDASVWCTAPTAPNVYAFQYDQMRYDRATDSYPADQGLMGCGISGF